MVYMVNRVFNNMESSRFVNFFAMVLNPVATPNIVGPTMLGVVVSVALGLLFIVNILIVRINGSFAFRLD